MRQWSRQSRPHLPHQGQRRRKARACFHALARCCSPQVKRKKRKSRPPKKPSASPRAGRRGDRKADRRAGPAVDPRTPDPDRVTARVVERRRPRKVPKRRVLKRLNNQEIRADAPAKRQVKRPVHPLVTGEGHQQPVPGRPPIQEMYSRKPVVLNSRHKRLMLTAMYKPRTAPAEMAAGAVHLTRRQEAGPGQRARIRVVL